jgi:tripartite-type tricarboxylate transporter receptor subunit TctC
MKTGLPAAHGRLGSTRVARLFGAFLTAFTVSAAGAATPDEAFPTAPLRIVVPYPAGGAGDLHGRLIAEKLGGLLGQNVIVENRTGASGNIGAEFVARSAPDGYTLLMHTTNLTIAPAVSSKLSFDVQKDFAPVSMTLTSQNLLVVPTGLPVNSIQELIAHAKANPGKLSYGSSGIGTPMLTVELLKAMAGLDIVHVPYRGDAPAIVDLIGGQIQIYATNILALQSYYKGGKLKALAVTSRRRAESLPEIPTMQEAGVPGYELESWFGFFAPAATPRARVLRLNEAIRKIVAMPDVRQQMIDTGAVPTSSTPEEFSARIAADVEKFTRVVRSSGIKVE